MWVVGFMNACAPPSGPDASIVVLPRIDSVVLGSTTAFSAQWGDGVGVDAAIHWMTSDSMVATVHANGSAHALELGVARITASVDGLESAPATLVVVPPPESAIGLTPSSARVPVGSIVLFTASSVGAGQGAPGVSYRWTTSDPRVAVVFEVPAFPYAMVVALRPGVTAISVANGSMVSAPSVFEVVGQPVS
jgi:uncharacterized protein YjdB